VASRELGFRLGHVKAVETTEARQKLRRLIWGGTPVLVCVDKYGHWVAAVRATLRHVWICDSVGRWDDPANDLPVYQRWTWTAFLRRVVFGLPEEARFDFYPVVRVAM
jgi:hypothetical protein